LYQAVLNIYGKVYRSESEIKRNEYVSPGSRLVWPTKCNLQ